MRQITQRGNPFMNATQFRPTYVSFDCYGALIKGYVTVASLDEVNTMLGS